MFTINAQGPILYQDFVVIVEDKRTTLDDTSFDTYLFIHACTTECLQSIQCFTEFHKQKSTIEGKINWLRLIFRFLPSDDSFHQRYLLWETQQSFRKCESYWQLSQLSAALIRVANLQKVIGDLQELLRLSRD